MARLYGCYTNDYRYTGKLVLMPFDRTTYDPTDTFETMECGCRKQKWVLKAAPEYGEKWATVHKCDRHAAVELSK